MEQVKNWEHSSWKYVSLVGDEEVISLLHTKVYVFSDSVLCLGKANENPQSNTAWEDRLTWFKFTRIQSFGHNWWWPDGIRLEYCPGFTTLQLCIKVQELLLRLSVTLEKFPQRIIFMSMFNEISWVSEDNQECESSAQLVSLCEEIWSRTMVIPRTWIRKEMVLCWWRQSTRRMGQNCRANNVDICTKPTPSIPIHESIIQRSAQKQRWWRRWGRQGMPPTDSRGSRTCNEKHLACDWSGTRREWRMN